MPRTSTNLPRLTKAAATRAVRAALTWDRNEPAVERAAGASEARHLLHWSLNDRVGLLRVLDAADRCPYAALDELQRLEPFANHAAGLVSPALFESHVVGAASGGISGLYGRAYLAELRSAGPYVASLH